MWVVVIDSPEAIIEKRLGLDLNAYVNRLIQEDIAGHAKQNTIVF